MYTEYVEFDEKRVYISDNNTANAVVIIKVIGNSFLTVLFLTCNEWNIAEVPNINKILRILLPITFPKTMSPLPASNDLTLTANSGALVPNATIVSPINILDTLKLPATPEAPSTNRSAPLISTANPTVKKIKFNIIITSIKNETNPFGSSLVKIQSILI